MKKIYYLQKYEVKLGDVIEYNGIKALVTKELIELNPELFIVKDPIQELLDKARGITMYTPEEGWCEIIPFKFTTEDGVDIYGDMKTYLVHSNDRTDIDFSLHTWDGDSINKPYKYFYHKENALAYIEKHKEKTLKDYEGILFRSEKSSTIISEKGTYWSTYSWIRDNEPKLYYTKILQLIADDLNDGWVADFNDDKEKWLIKEGTSDCTMGTSGWTVRHNCGAVPFKTKELSEKARNILGDKVKYLFN